MSHVATSATCRKVILGVEVEFPIFVDYPYLLPTDIKPKAPARPYNPERDYANEIVESPPDPGSEAVETALEMLDEEGYELLREQIDWGLTPGAQPDDEPARGGVRDEPRDRECKDYFGDAPGSDPGARAPGARREAADWDYDVESFEEVFNPLTEMEQTVKLRWGTREWGYRHIVIRHGWDSAAELRTELALQTDRVPTLDAEHDPTDQSFLYYYNVPGLPGGMRCRQLVSVSYGTNTGISVGRHVITSYIQAYS